jgi:ribosome-binding protein aMBF1 (putative translation factor)
MISLRGLKVHSQQKGSVTSQLMSSRHYCGSYQPVKLSRRDVVGKVIAGSKMTDSGYFVGTNLRISAISSLAERNKVSAEMAERLAYEMGFEGEEENVFIGALTEGEVEVDPRIVPGLFDRSKCEDKKPSGISAEGKTSLETVAAQDEEPASKEDPKSVPDPGALNTKGLVAEGPANTSKAEIAKTQAIESASTEESQGKGTSEETLILSQATDAKPKKRGNERQPKKLTAKEWDVIFSAAGDYPEIIRNIIRQSGKKEADVSGKIGKSKAYLSVFFLKRNFHPDEETNSKLISELEIPEVHMQKCTGLWDEFKLTCVRKKGKKEKIASKTHEELVFSDITAKGKELLKSVQGLLTLNNEEIARVVKRLIKDISQTG